MRITLTNENKPFFIKAPQVAYTEASCYKNHKDPRDRKSYMWAPLKAFALADL